MRCISFHKCIYFEVALHVSDGLPVHYQASMTVHTASGISQTDPSDCMLACSQKDLFDCS